jgi:hypothetical protein
MGMNRRRGFETDFLTDLANSGRISLGKNLILEIIKNFLLFLGNLSGHWRDLLLSIVF